ncbi:MAG TPA: NAD-dependent epimerase/dehydratase family protein [Polyangiaceae bacterium]|nr:NAD-dependent epimerase/dehydratase family protein [Polyangiaceae bacterium]
MKRIALIVGAAGSFGSETARALLRHGFQVRGLARSPEKARAAASWVGDVEWVKGDAMNAADVLAAAEGASVVVHGAHPPGYRNWKGLALPMLESSIAAAKAVGARLVFPGTLYNFGPDAFPVVTESSPQRPLTRKGAIRVAMEQRLEEASRDGVRVLIVRAGDFFGPHTGGGSWFSAGLVRPRKPLGALMYPESPETGHAWAYLPDLAETIARLLDREPELSTFERFHFGGHWFERGVELAERTRDAAGVPAAKIRKFPWFLIVLLSPFVETFREMLEMRYLWSTPVRLGNDKLVSFLREKTGEAEPHTEITVALRETLEGLGCLPRRPDGHAAFGTA